MVISPTEENYLKAIYHLQALSEVVSTTHLAQKLQTKPASVTDMMKKLQAKNLLHYTPYHGFSLSAEGRKTALHIVRRHRLWEYFLAEKLSFEWNEVHEVAEELEHIGNKKLIEKLDAYLGFPQFDPHGDPIPDSRGRMQQPELVPLSTAPIAFTGVLQLVTDQSKDLLEHLASRKLRIGTRLELRSRSAFDGSVDIKMGSKTLTLTRQLANHLLLKQI
ncbi:iron (metal) dependent repressor, DtxR family [Cnuella takakiae]|uniref:Transcriptional regulator MntR n=1 Tax=Cnuella takakiae TaxID=1302690 RepID=A0A1M4UTQ9_9BACT|nr:metal-dependent transcriptional regulator [Cnuella takakiae]OLY92779.1 iron-dependent repressor [Cnuella takakiae]SHE60141.1 iron (metal) dependent repressor, DtxR family [Cnuella takakiae]